MKFTVMKSKVDISNNLSKMNDNTSGNIISKNVQLNQRIIDISKVLINFIQNTKGIVLRQIQFKFLEEFQTGIIFYMGIDEKFYY